MRDRQSLFDLATLKVGKKVDLCFKNRGFGPATPPLTALTGGAVAIVEALPAIWRHSDGGIRIAGTPRVESGSQVGFIEVAGELD